MPSVRAASLAMSVVALTSGMGVLSIACSKSSSPSSHFDFGDAPTGTTTTPKPDSGTPPPDDGSTTTDGATDSGTTRDASDTAYGPDFGPIPDVEAVDGPTTDPPPTLGALTFCPSATDKLSGAGLTPTGVPTAFIDAWNSEASKHAGPVLLLQLDDLKSDPQKVVLSVGTADGASPPSFSTEAFSKTSLPATIDSVTRVTDAEVETASFELLFETGSSLPVGTVKLRGTLDSKCEAMTGVTLSLKISTKNGGRTFAGSTLSALLGPANDTIRSDDAWRIDLVGTATFVGR